jgi:hypothetical protein
LPWVSAITQTPTSGPAGPVTTPPISLSPMSIAGPASSEREDAATATTSAAVIAVAHRSTACVKRLVINDGTFLATGCSVRLRRVFAYCIRRFCDGPSGSPVPEARTLLRQQPDECHDDERSYPSDDDALLTSRKQKSKIAMVSRVSSECSKAMEIANTPLFVRRPASVAKRAGTEAHVSYWH